MKKRVFNLCMLLLVIASNNMAQEKPYLVTEGKQWAVCTHLIYPGDFCSTNTYLLKGDTIIAGKSYKVEYKAVQKNLSDMKPSGRFMREEEGKVYSKLQDYPETLYFDFNMEIGDTIHLKREDENPSYVSMRLVEIRDTILPNGDGKTRKCYYIDPGRYEESGDTIAFSYTSIPYIEDIGFINKGLCEQTFFFVDGAWTELLYVKQNDTMLYQKEEGVIWKEKDESGYRELTRRGYGLYYGDTYLYKYTINEAEGVTDSTDFAVWNDKSVIYFDVDTVGNNAFTNATFRRGQILYFTEKLKCIMPDAFSNIMMLDDEPTEKNPFGDLCIAFSGDYVPNIEKNSICNYADTTYRITYVVPDLEAYIAKDIQWTYSQLVTIDDFVKGYISPENEITVNDSTEVDVDVNNNTNGNNVSLTVNARPRKDIPIRIGDGENKDIYSRAPAWMRYTVEVKIISTDGTTLYTGSKQCSAYDECVFTASFARPANGIVYVHSRSIDQFNRASEWTVEKVYLEGHEYEGDYVTDANVNLNKTAEAAELTATVGTDSIRITGYYYSNCGGGLYCGAIARGHSIELVFYDGVLANCYEYHYVDFTIPRFSDELDRIDVVSPFPLEVKVQYESRTTYITASEDNVYYDLMGRKVVHPTRGIYIKNGRKMIVE